MYLLSNSEAARLDVYKFAAAGTARITRYLVAAADVPREPPAQRWVRDDWRLQLHAQGQGNLSDAVWLVTVSRQVLTSEAAVAPRHTWCLAAAAADVPI